MLPAQLRHVPAPSPEAQALSQRLLVQIREAIATSGGWISFAHFMELALYAPGLGYYSAGSAKLGRAGDFVTAPELSPLFSRCLARQVAELLALGLPDVIEVGAGSGALAAEVLQALNAHGCLPNRYLILEVSADLRARQRDRIEASVPELIDRVHWLDVLPTRLHGVLLANEVLDAIPVHVVRRHENRLEEMGVEQAADHHGIARGYRPAAGDLLHAAEALDLPDDYETEVNPAARAFVKSFARIIERGVLLLIDYGFPAAEYYHPQRNRGTLMCHYKHHAHDDPLALVGLQDITAHVDFTALAEAGTSAGLRVLGYTTQAQFLVNCGITEILSETPADDVLNYAPLASQAQKLLSPAEMGELFKVMALGRGIDQPLMGFSRGDRTHTLQGKAALPT